MICLSDNDIIQKLAFCDLLEEVPEVLNVTQDDIFVLETAKWVLLRPFKDPEKSKTRLGEVVYDRIRRFLEKVKTIEIAPDTMELQLFEEPGWDRRRRGGPFFEHRALPRISLGHWRQE